MSDFARTSFDLAWLAWAFFLATTALCYATGMINTSTNYRYQVARVAFAFVVVVAWPVMRVWVL